MGIRSLSNPKVVAKLSGFVRNTLDDGTNIDAALEADVNTTLTSGVGPSMANRGWQWKSRTLASGANVVIDLYDYASLDAGAGAGNDSVGQVLTVEAIVALMIKNENTVGVAGTLEIEPDATNGWTPIGTHTVATLGGLRGGGVLLKYQPDSTGFDVVDASSHRIKLTANGGDITYSVWMWGRHDDETSSSSLSSSSSTSGSSSPSSSSPSSSSSSSSSSSATSSASSLSASSSSLTSSASSQSSSSSSLSSESSSSEGA